MAFDQSTRNRLQKFVSIARNLLTDEFTRQLQATYGLDPKSGSVAEIESLTHLDNRQRQTAHLLRETLMHYLSTTPGKGEKDRTKQVLDRIVREQAFTVLNRLAALRMAEARGFLLESITKAHSSKGFQLYRQLSGTAHGETGDAYRNYLFSLFDEFSLDLAVLFDRHSAQGRLFPRESSLLELLAEINHHEIEHLWAEDETIGWIYQYFNSQEERKKMRAESQAPRNSRELAVRNQFFTPRYVVEFLTDNTLGRIWYEMTQGSTGLVDSCRYLVRRPTEVFLKPGEAAPETDPADSEALSQEELLKQPVYIPHRPLKDPRNIRMLDPACGSMHFGLYAFDLFECIYLEAWQLEQQLGSDAFAREEGLQPLQTTFASLEAFQQQIPKLIIEHNIHGVDIDPRAVQIAGLSLWQRAQRAWYQQGIKPQQRPTIVKSNIVCAEPMPGEKALLQEFTSKLNPPILGQLLEVIFDKMQLAGEAGTLLKIEEEIQTAIHEAREQWVKQSGSQSMGDMFQAELDAATPQAKLGFDLRGIDDETFWDDAERRILEALSDYADQAESNADQKRLFAEDAAKGFAFIDLCRKRFDVVLMNPPFGEASKDLEGYLKNIAKKMANDLAVAFNYRGNLMLHDGGVFGAITTRTIYYLEAFEEWREQFLLGECKIVSFLDFGMGVLDAVVETAAIVSRKDETIESALFIDCDPKDFQGSINSALSEQIYKIVPLEFFDSLPSKPLAYKIPQNLVNLSETTFEKAAGVVKQGLGTSDDFRFLRLFWESTDNDKWKWYAKGGSSQGYYSSIHLKVNFLRDGRELWSNLSKSGGIRSNIWMLKDTIKEYFYKPGLTFTYRSKVFPPEVLPAGCIFGVTGMTIFPSSSDELYAYLAWFNSSPINYLILNTAERYEPLFQAGKINKTPWRRFSGEAIGSISKEIVDRKIFVDTYRITSPYFCGPSYDKDLSIFNNHKRYSKLFYEADILVETLRKKIDNDMLCQYGIDQHDKNLIEDDIDSRRADFKKFEGVSLEEYSHLLVELMAGVVFHRFAFSKLFDAVDGGALIDAFEPLPSNSFTTPKSMSDSHGKYIFTGTEIIGKLGYWAENELGISSDELVKVFGAEGLKGYFNSLKGFFETHLNLHSQSRRQAPLYWPLQTSSGSYTLWVYYHSLNKQTLYTCVNDFVEPKLEQVEQDLNTLRGKSARNSQEENELEKLSDLASELRDFRDELLRLAKFWKPNLNDGVQITAAPLWKLFQHKAWQKKLKETWEILEKGGYDWAHLACSIWPERVLRKCHQDRSLAIAHDVENHFWHEVEVPVKRGKKTTGETKLEWQPKDLSEAELTALVKQLAAEM